MMQQSPAVRLDKEQTELLGAFSGMHLAFTFEDRHFSSPEKIDRASWMILTFYAHLELHVQSFKVRSLGLTVPSMR